MAATNAYYKHHERTTYSDLMGDLQTREVGFAADTHQLIGLSELSGTYTINVKESSNPAFNNTLSLPNGWNVGTFASVDNSGVMDVIGVLSVSSLGVGIESPEDVPALTLSPYDISQVSPVLLVQDSGGPPEPVHSWYQDGRYFAANNGVTIYTLSSTGDVVAASLSAVTGTLVTGIFNTGADNALILTQRSDVTDYNGISFNGDVDATILGISGGSVSDNTLYFDAPNSDDGIGAYEFRIDTASVVDITGSLFHSYINAQFDGNIYNTATIFGTYGNFSGDVDSGVIDVSINNTADSGFAVLKLIGSHEYQMSSGGSSSGQDGGWALYDATATAVRIGVDSSGTTTITGQTNLDDEVFIGSDLTMNGSHINFNVDYSQILFTDAGGFIGTAGSDDPNGSVGYAGGPSGDAGGSLLTQYASGASSGFQGCAIQDLGDRGDETGSYFLIRGNAGGTPVSVAQFGDDFIWRMNSSGAIQPFDSNGSLFLSGGSAGAGTDPYIQIQGQNNTNAEIVLALGANEGSAVIVTDESGVTTYFQINGSNIQASLPVQFYSTVAFNNGNNTGAGAALLGANSPSAHLTSPYTWVDVIAADGTPCTMPIWKK